MACCQQSSSSRPSMTGGFSKRGRRTGADFSGDSLVDDFAAGVLPDPAPAEVGWGAGLLGGDCALTTRTLAAIKTSSLNARFMSTTVTLAFLSRLKRLIQ